MIKKFRKADKLVRINWLDYYLSLRDNRRFNQAVEIARPLMGLDAGRMNLNAIKRARAGPPQSSLPANRRHANVHAAFELGIPTGAKTVLIVDDVVTTGATLTAVARVLKQGGARRIHALAVADALV